MLRDAGLTVFLVVIYTIVMVNVMDCKVKKECEKREAQVEEVCNLEL